MASHRTRRVLALGIVATCVGLAAAVIAARPEPEGIDRARSILASDASFSDGAEAGSAMARVASALLDEAEQCAKRLGPSAPACEARFSASARAQVVAVDLLSCSLPGVFEARRDMRRFVDAIAALEDDVSE